MDFWAVVFGIAGSPAIILTWTDRIWLILNLIDDKSPKLLLNIWNDMEGFQIMEKINKLVPDCTMFLCGY